MQSLTVRDLMVPKGEYATISADSTLSEAVLALQDAQLDEQELDPTRHRDRALLVIDDRDRVIGKLSMLNVLQGLMPGSEKERGSSASSKAATRVGSARSLIASMGKEISLWNKPLSNLIEKASTIVVRHLIRDIAKGETVNVEDSLDRALHQLIEGRFQSLLVTSDGEIIGILRLTDIYDEISKRLREHNAENAGDSMTG